MSTDQIDYDYYSSVDTKMEDAPMVVVSDEPTSSSCRSEIRFEDLPIEIHEAILDHLFGERGSTFTTAVTGKLSAQNWTKALRHPRRKALSNLGLISPVWRPLVQDRIYRHSQFFIRVSGGKVSSFLLSAD